MKNIQIVFNNPSNILYSGQSLTGKIEINIDSTKKIKAIHVLFIGEANVKWVSKETVLEGTKKEIKNISYKGHETYLNQSIYVLGSANSGATELKPGQHSYDFSCLVPVTAPSSFQGERGDINYCVKVTVTRPWKLDKILSKSFTVMLPYNLNCNPSLKNPCVLTIHKSYHCCFFKSGQINVRISIPCKGFVVGEAVLFSVDIENTSNVHIRNIKYILSRKTSYHSLLPTKSTKTETETVTKFRSGRSFGAGISANFNERFMLPFIPPSDLIYCGIIDISYIIYVNVSFSGLHKSRGVTFPIEIGTIPLDQMNNTSLNSTQIGWDPNISDSSTAHLLPSCADESTGVTTAYSTILPPYDETHSKNRNSNVGFNYPVVPSAPVDNCVPGPSAPIES